MTAAYDAAYPPLAAELAKKPALLAVYTDGTHAYSESSIQQIHAAGVPILLNHERLPDQLLGGHAAGVQAASDALSAVSAFGVPLDGTVAVCFSVDVSVPPTQYETVGQAFDGINSVLAGKLVASCYGQGGLIDYLASTHRTGAKGWLSGSSSFPGYNRNSPNVGMWQHVGTDVPGTDLDTVTDLAGLRPWYPPNQTPAAEQDPDMPRLVQDSATGQQWRVGELSITPVRDKDHSPTEIALWGAPVVKSTLEIQYMRDQTHDALVQVIDGLDDVLGVAKAKPVGDALTALAAGVDAVPGKVVTSQLDPAVITNATAAALENLTLKKVDAA